MLENVRLWVPGSCLPIMGRVADAAGEKDELLGLRRLDQGGQLAPASCGAGTRLPGSGALSGGEPFLEGILAFPGGFAGYEPLDADVLVQLVPMNPAASPYQPPCFAFGRGCMHQSREPSEGN